MMKRRLLWTVAAVSLAWSAPCARGAPAAPAPPVKPFMAYAWSRTDAFDNIVPFFWIRADELDPAKAKGAADPMPEGHRALFSWDVHRTLSQDQQDYCRTADGKRTDQPGIWWDHGVEAVARTFDDFFKRYKDLGGKLDAFVLDSEDGLSNWHFGDKPQRWQAIAADPRFAPLATQLGFTDLMTVCRWWEQKGDARDNLRRWNALQQKRVAAYVNRAVYEPIRRHFPNVRMSNYGDSYNAARFCCPDINGWDYAKFGEGAHVGTHQSASLYGWVGQLRDRKLDGRRPYGATPFAAFRLSVNGMRSMVLSSPVPVQPWLSHKQFNESLFRTSDLYQELIFHVGLSGPDVFLYWNPLPWRKDQDRSEFTDAGQDRLFSGCLEQLDELAGAADRKTLVADLAGWYDDYVLTGMQAGGRTVWRFTPNLPDGAPLEGVLVSESPATFKVGDRTVTIPGGRIREPRAALSKAGYWIVAPAGTRPVVEEPAPARPQGPG